jgi:hypothetical protein
MPQVLVKRFSDYVLALPVFLAIPPRLPRRRARRRACLRPRLLPPIELRFDVLADISPPVVLEFVFCAKTRVPKLRTKTRAITIPKFFLTDVSPFDVPQCGI